MNYMLIVTIVFLIVIGFFAVMYLIEHNRREKLQIKYDQLDEMYDKACIELENMRQAKKIKIENKEKADAEIEELHNGNPVDNAINILCKY